MAILPLKVRHLQFEAQGVPLLRGISFDLDAGPVTVLIGPNGAGKSLTLRLLHGLLTPSGGEILWGGAAPTRPIRRRQAMVFQRPVLLRRSVRANVDYALRAHGIPRPERHRRIAEALTQAGLQDLARQSARVLSGGEQQRLALARAWAVHPDVLFLDEPTANLDPAATATVEHIIARIRDQGVKIVLATHDMGQARRIGDEVLFFNKGYLVERSDARRFFTQPQSEAARAYLTGCLIV